MRKKETFFLSSVCDDVHIGPCWRPACRPVRGRWGVSEACCGELMQVNEPGKGMISLRHALAARVIVTDWRTRQDAARWRVGWITDNGSQSGWRVYAVTVMEGREGEGSVIRRHDESVWGKMADELEG